MIVHQVKENSVPFNYMVHIFRSPKGIYVQTYNETDVIALSYKRIDYM